MMSKNLGHKSKIKAIKMKPSPTKFGRVSIESDTHSPLRTQARARGVSIPKQDDHCVKTTQRGRCLTQKKAERQLSENTVSSVLGASLALTFDPVPSNMTISFKRAEPVCARQKTRAQPFMCVPSSLFSHTHTHTLLTQLIYSVNGKLVTTFALVLSRSTELAGQRSAAVTPEPRGVGGGGGGGGDFINTHIQKQAQDSEEAAGNLITTQTSSRADLASENKGAR